MKKGNRFVWQYGVQRRNLKIFSYGVVTLLLVLQIFCGYAKHQKVPLVSIDGLTPAQISGFVGIGLVSILIFIINYWKCPKCQNLFFFSLKAKRNQYTYDLESCPNCKIFLREK